MAKKSVKKQQKVEKTENNTMLSLCMQDKDAFNSVIAIVSITIIVLIVAWIL